MKPVRLVVHSDYLCPWCYNAAVRLRRDHQEVNAKSIMGVMMLAAAKGSAIEVCANGADADEALAEIARLVQNRFGEPE